VCCVSVCLCVCVCVCVPARVGATEGWKALELEIIAAVVYVPYQEA